MLPLMVDGAMSSTMDGFRITTVIRIMIGYVPLESPLLVMRPCGHANVCKVCCEKINKCPNCRKSIEKLDMIYL